MIPHCLKAFQRLIRCLMTLISSLLIRQQQTYVSPISEKISISYFSPVHKPSAPFWDAGPLFATIRVRICIHWECHPMLKPHRFYGGNIIFRGHFNASGEETSINLSVQGGYGFGYSAFLNGVFLGSNQGNASVSMTTDSWKIPSSTLQIGKDNVVAVIQGRRSDTCTRPH